MTFRKPGERPQHFHIQLGTHGGAKGNKVELDGVELSSLTNIRITSDVREATVVSCDFINVTVSGDVEALEVGAER
jgi:hypothetical protein